MVINDIIWRVLILYKYGGWIYSDVDNTPITTNFIPDVYPINTQLYSFFVGADKKLNRLSYCFFLHRNIINRCYIQFAMDRIIAQLLGMHDMLNPKIMDVTGPSALQYADAHFLSNTRHYDMHDILFN